MLVLLLILSCIIEAFGQENWELKRSQPDLAIYTSSYPGSDFKMFKAVQKLKANSMAEIAAILVDVEHYTELFPDAKIAKKISKQDDGHFIHFLVTDLPWPVDDRSGVYEISTTYNKELNEVHMKVACIPYEFKEEANTIRMTKGNGFWKIREISKWIFEVTFQYHADPAGKIPAWLANSFVVDNPFKTMQNLKKIIATGKYSNASVDFLN